jgi:hypothetical protein
MPGAVGYSVERTAPPSRLPGHLGEERGEQTAPAVLGRDGHRRDAGRRHRGAAEPGLVRAVDGDGHELAAVLDAPEPTGGEVEGGGPRLVAWTSAEGLAGQALHDLEVVRLERSHRRHAPILPDSRLRVDLTLSRGYSRRQDLESSSL